MVYEQNYKKITNSLVIVNTLYKTLTKNILEALALHAQNINMREDPQTADILNVFNENLIVSKFKPVHFEIMSEYRKLDDSLKLQISLIQEFIRMYENDRAIQTLELIEACITKMVLPLKERYIIYIEKLKGLKETPDNIIPQTNQPTDFETDCNEQDGNLYSLRPKIINLEGKMSKINSTNINLFDEQISYKVKFKLSDQTVFSSLMKERREAAVDKIKKSLGSDDPVAIENAIYSFALGGFTPDEIEARKGIRQIDKQRRIELREFFKEYNEADSMDLSENNFETRHVAVSLVKGLDVSTNLVKLDLSSCNLELASRKIERFLPRLFQSITNLTSLNLSGNDLHKLEFANMEKVLGSVLSFKNLTYLNLSSNKLWFIDSFSRMTSLTKLDLSHNDELNILRLGNLPNLTTIDFSNSSIDTIVSFGCMTSLTNLDLSKTRISHVGSFKGLPNLTILDLSHNFLSGDYWDHNFPSMVKHLTNLLKLDLSNSHISGEYWSKSLPKALENLINLTDLNLSGNGISAGGWRSDFFNYIAKNTVLTNLDLSNNNMNGLDCGEKLSSALKANKALKYLNLIKNPIFAQNLDLTEVICKINVEVATETEAVCSSDTLKKCIIQQIIEESKKQNAPIEKKNWGLAQIDEIFTRDEIYMEDVEEVFKQLFTHENHSNTEQINEQIQLLGGDLYEGHYL